MIKIDAKNVDFYYGDFHALKNISMEIEPNTSTAVSYTHLTLPTNREV